MMEVRQVRIVLPDELHRDLKRRAIDEGMPLKELPAKFPFDRRR
ncbi:MAG: hypothetical protein WB564_07115 [Dehalococcoidia bacterium]